MDKLIPIRDFCTSNSTAREWMQSCLSEIVNEAIKAKDYAAVAAASELMLAVVPDQRLVVQPQEPDEVVVPEVLPPLPADHPDSFDWAGPRVRAEVETRILQFLKDYRRTHGVAYAGATSIIDEIEKPYTRSGKWRQLPTSLEPTDTNFTRVAKPWRSMINSVLYELSCRKVLDKKHRSYRLAATQRKATKESALTA
jgi:hypothetical protein